MNTIDKRVLEVDFDNKNFERNAQTSINTLDKFEKKAQSMDKLTSGLSKFGDGLFKTSKSVASLNDYFTSLSSSSRALVNANMDTANAIDSISSRFSALGIVGMSVLNNLTTAAMNLAGKFLTVLPNAIIEGGFNRALTLEQAKFTLQGLLSDAQAVQDVLDTATESVKDTAYTSADAAKAAALLAASGITAKEELAGVMAAIAGTTATVNGNYESISNIFSTIKSNGRLMTMQIRQFSTQGLNVSATLAKVFQEVMNGTSALDDAAQSNIRSIKAVAEASTNAKVSAIDWANVTEESINELVSAGLINFEAFSDAMELTFGKHAKDANKTFTGATANIRAALARTGEMFFKPIIEQESPLVQFLNHIRVGINGVNNALKPLAANWTDTFNKGLSVINEYLTYFNQYSELVDNIIKQEDLEFGGGTTNKLLALSNTVTQVTDAIKQGFLDIFPNLDLTEEELVQLTVKIRDFLRGISIAPYNLEKIRVISSGVFGALKIGGSILSASVKWFGRLLDALSPIGGMFVDIAGSIGHFFTALANSKVLQNAFGFVDGYFKNIFDELEHGLGVVRKHLAHTLEAFDKWIDEGHLFNTVAKYIIKAATGISNIFGTLSSVLAKAWYSIRNLVQSIINGFVYMVTGIDHSLSGAGIDSIFGVIDLIIAKLFGLGEVASRIKGFVGDAISQVFSSLGNQIKNIDIGSFLTALMGLFQDIAVFNFGYILKNIAGVFKAFERFLTGTQSGPIIFTRISSILTDIGSLFGRLETILSVQYVKQFAEALLMLAGALMILSFVDPARLTDATAALVALVTVLSLSMGALSSISTFKGAMGLYNFTGPLVAMGTALLIISFAVAKLASMNTDELIQGITSAIILLGGLAGAMALMSKFSSKAVGKTTLPLIAMAISISMLAKVIETLGNMDMDTLSRGMLGVSTLILALSAAMMAIGQVHVNPGAFAALIGIAAAIRILVTAVSSLGGMDVKTLQYGLGGVFALIAGLALITAVIGTVNARSLLSASVMMLAIGAAIAILTKSLSTIAALNPDSMINALFAIVTMMAMLGGITQLIKADGILKAGVSFVLMGAAIEILADALAKLAVIEDTNLLKGFISIAAALALFAVAAEMLGNAIPTAAAILLFSTAIAIMAGGLALLAALPTENLVGAMIAIALAFGAFVAAAFLVQPIIGPLVAFATILIMVGGAISLFGSGLYFASSAAIMFINAAKLFANEGANVFVEAISTLLDVLVAISGKLADTIGQLFVQIAVAIETYAPQIADHLLGALVAVINTVAANLGPLIDALFNLGKAIIEALWEGLKGIREKAGEFLSEFFGGIDIGKMISDMIALGAQAIAGFFSGIGDFLLNNPVADFIGGILDGTAELPDLFRGKGVETGQSYVAGLDSVDASAAGDRLGEESMNGLKNSAVSVAGEASDEMVNKFVSTMQARAGEATSGGEAIGDSAGTGAESVDFGIPADSDLMQYVDYFTSNAGLAEPGGVALAEEGKSGAESVDFSSAGYQSDAGYAQGLLNNAYLAENAAREVARRAKAALEDEITIESPSKAYMEDGQLSVMGYALGLLNNAKIAANAAAQVGNTAYSALSNAINNWDINGIDFDTAPTIRPIMDLSNVTAGFNFINSMFGSYQNRELAFIGVPDAMGRTVFDGTSNGNVTYQLVIDRAVYNDVPQIESIISNAFDIMGQYRGMNYG